MAPGIPFPSDDILGLQSYVVEAQRSAAKVQIDEVLKDTRNPTVKAVEDVFNRILLKGEKIGPEELAKLPGEILESISAAWKDNPVPSYFAIPILALLTVAIGGKGLLDVVSVTSEKDVIQGIRKAIRPTLPDLASLVEMEARDEKFKEKTDDVGARLGYPKEFIEMYRRLFQYAPNAQDLITFAVREAFDDTKAGQFQTDTDVDKVLAASEKFRKAAGLTDEIFRLYWRSHWELPSVNQGFELFHRGELSGDELASLLVAKDFTPFWQEKLLRLSYQLLTRVDVRRMHDIGIIKDADLAAEYRKMGHSPEDAEKLAKFTILYNADKEEAEKTTKDRVIEKERDLSQGEIVRAYRSSVIGRDKASALLTMLKYSGEEVNIILQNVDFQREREFVDKLVDSYHDLFIKGLIGREDADKLLKEIPIPATQIKQLFRLWDVEKLKTFDVPTRADVVKWFKRGRIERDEAEQLLLSGGTQPEFIPFYLEE